MPRIDYQSRPQGFLDRVPYCQRLFDRQWHGYSGKCYCSIPRAIKSCIRVACDILDNPPAADIYNPSIIVEYLLCIANLLNQGADILMRTKITPLTRKEFRAVRIRLLKTSVTYRRFLVTLFLLLMFSPLCYLQKLHCFRKNYYRLQQVVRQICHKTDFLRH